jgi:hypothetical protein
MSNETDAPAAAAQTNRRVILKGAITMASAALAMKPKLSLAAVKKAPKPDPIFALIERFDKAWDIYVEADELSKTYHAQYVKPLIDSGRAAPGMFDLLIQDTPYTPAYKALNESSDVLESVTKEILNTAPTTTAGVAVALDWLAWAVEEEEFFEGRGILASPSSFITGLATSLRGLST